MRAAAIVILVSIVILAIAATCATALPRDSAQPASSGPDSGQPRKHPAKPAAVVGGPSDQLRAHLERIVTALRERAGGRASAPDPGHAALLGMFDLDETARRVVTRGVGDDLTGSQQRELMTVLTDVMSRVVGRLADYLRLARNESLERYASAPLGFRESLRNDGEAVVEGALPGKGGREIEMTAWMVRRGPRWLVYDLGIDDATLVESYRAQCTAILRRSSYAALLARLREKRNTLEIDEAATSALPRPAPTLAAPTVIPRPGNSPAMRP